MLYYLLFFLSIWHLIYQLVLCSNKVTDGLAVFQTSGHADVSPTFNFNTIYANTISSQSATALCHLVAVTYSKKCFARVIFFVFV